MRGLLGQGSSAFRPDGTLSRPTRGRLPTPRECCHPSRQKVDSGTEVSARYGLTGELLSVALDRVQNEEGQRAGSLDAANSMTFSASSMASIASFSLKAKAGIPPGNPLGYLVGI